MNKPIIVNYPYTAEKIGDSCLKCFDTVISNNFSAGDIGEPVIKTKRNKDMTRLYQYQSIAFEPQRGYTMIPTLGEKDGTFHFLGIENGVQLDYSASKVELGEKVISTFYLCP